MSPQPILPIHCPGLPGVWWHCPGPSAQVSVVDITAPVVIVLGIILLFTIMTTLLVYGLRD